jgi:ATP-dependent Clp protease, protease subunit
MTPTASGVVAYMALLGPTTDDATAKLAAAVEPLRERKAEILHLFISSRGGENAAGFAMHHLLRSLTCHVVTHNVGTVSSSAVSVYLAGEYRYVCPHARFGLHGSHLDMDTPHPVTRFKTNQLRQMLQGLERGEAKTAELLHDRTNLTRSEAAGLLGELTHFSAAWGIEKGLAHDIRDVPTKPDGSPVIRLPLAQFGGGTSARILLGDAA